eukprot:4026895-Amphidinium_carterae.1
MCPTALQEHLEFHSARLTTFKAAKDEIDSYLDVKIAGSSSPMDVDLLQGKGKGKSQGKQESCRHCGRKITQAHTEYACWFNPKNPSPEAKAKREAKGKGKRNDG